jgi:hypothetical protein
MSGSRMHLAVFAFALAPLACPCAGQDSPKASCAGQAGQISFDLFQKQTERSCSELAATEAHLIGFDGAANVART